MTPSARFRELADKCFKDHPSAECGGSHNAGDCQYEVDFLRFCGSNRAAIAAALALAEGRDPYEWDGDRCEHTCRYCYRTKAVGLLPREEGGDGSRMCPAEPFDHGPECEWAAYRSSLREGGEGEGV